MTGADIVWLTEWRTYGFLIHVGAYASLVMFTDPRTGEQVMEDIENDEYELWMEHAIEYDTGED